MIYKAASACLPDKVYGHQANSLGAGIMEGYKLGFTHLHASKDWASPVAIEIVAPRQCYRFSSQAVKCFDI